MVDNLEYKSPYARDKNDVRLFNGLRGIILGIETRRTRRVRVMFYLMFTIAKQTLPGPGICFQWGTRTESTVSKIHMRQCTQVHCTVPEVIRQRAA